jgi:hypothetical protein
MTLKTTLIILTFMAFGSGKTKAQDKVAELTIDRDETLKEAVYSKNNGFWAISGNVAILKRTLENTITKYAPDLSKKEWTVKVPLGISSSSLVYFPSNPTYLYYVNVVPGITVFNGDKVTVSQISPKGKLIEKEHPKDEILDTHLSSFCNASAYIELWSKKKSEDYVLVKYDNATFQRSKSTIKLPDEKQSKGYTEWFYADNTDSTLLLARYNKKEDGQMEVAVLSLADGKISKQFVFKPEIGALKITPVRNIRYGDGATFVNIHHTKNSNHTSTHFEPEEYGDMKFSPDGKGLIHYSMLSFSGKKRMITAEYRPEGYMLSKLDWTGKVMWTKKEEVNEAEVGTMFRNNATNGDMLVELKDLNDKSSVGLEVQYNDTEIAIANSRRARATFGRKYDSNGAIVDKCLKSFSIKRKMMEKEAKVSVKNTESLLPCFSKSTTKRLTEYIEKKGIDGTYSVFLDGGSGILLIVPKDDKQVVGCLYFKD